MIENLVSIGHGTEVKFVTVCARICNKSRFITIPLKFCPEEASLAPVRNLSRIFVALDPAALKIVDNSGLRPLHTLLQALDTGLPSWWNESYWGDSAGGPDWEVPVPTTSTATRTTTRTQDLESLLCCLAQLGVKIETCSLILLESVRGLKHPVSCN